jgi:hypothetical protein
MKERRQITEAEALKALESWARACASDTKLYRGLVDAVEDLDRARSARREE